MALQPKPVPSELKGAHQAVASCHKIQDLIEQQGPNHTAPQLDSKRPLPISRDALVDQEVPVTQGHLQFPRISSDCRAMAMGADEGCMDKICFQAG